MSGPAIGRLEELFLQHADAAGRLAYLLTGDRELADDLVQDAFVRLARRFAHLRDPEAFPAYLQRTIVNLARSQFRRRRVERAFLRSQGPAFPDRTEGPDADDADRLAGALLRFLSASGQPSSCASTPTSRSIGPPSSWDAAREP